MESQPRNPSTPSGPDAPSSGRPWWLFAAGGALLLAGVGLIVGAATMAGREKPVDQNLSLAAEQQTGETVPTPLNMRTVTSKPPTPKATATTAAPKKQEPTAEPTKKPVKKPKAKPIRPKADTGYRLYNVVTGKCLGTMSLDVSVTQELCTASPKIKLVETRVDAGVQLYQVHTTSGAELCLDPPGVETNSAGTVVGATTCWEPTTDNQEWSLRDVGEVKNGREIYALVNRASALCLDVLGSAADGGDALAGLNLTLAGCTDGGYDDRLWTFS